jgi:ubiquitin carboxyl-terminal hydrolase 9/24
MIDNCE